MSKKRLIRQLLSKIFCFILFIKEQTLKNMVVIMELESMIITINNLLKLDFNDNFRDFVYPQKHIMSIPSYQREYKWKNSKIKTFVDNIMQRSKFLGIITIEAPNSNLLSIVDGQQRLTTIILMLAQLYNACSVEGETETQDEIEDLITCEINGQRIFKLENESIGEYLHFFIDQDNNRKINLEINRNDDIYMQSCKFLDAWNIIEKEINEMRQRNPDITLDVYKQKLLDCQILLFAQKNTDNMQQGSSEEIYIDINEKAQKLDPEDIFKGHCFAICKTVSQQNRVKILWRSIKQKFFAMDQIFKKLDMGAFLHFYLLTQEATRIPRQDIKKDLTISGENIITQRYNTPTKAIRLLKDIEAYQTNLMDFMSKLNLNHYDYCDIMSDNAQVLGNNSHRIKEFTSILTNIITCNQNLFKLPLFYMIDVNYRKEEGNKLSYHQLSNFIYLYYFYMFLFSRLNGSRKREDLASNLIYKLQADGDFLIQFIKDIKNYSNGFEIAIDEKTLNDEVTRKHLYSILDYFRFFSQNIPNICDATFFVKFRLFPENYNIEHLIVNQSHNVLWRSIAYNEASANVNLEYTFTIDDFSVCPAWLAPNNCWANFILVDEEFNRNILKNNDIINKIIMLRGTYIADDAPHRGTYAKKHSHIEIICQHIMNTNGYRELLAAYKNNESRENVLRSYQIFINNYFSEKRLEELRNTLTSEFIRKLQELCQII